VIIGVEFDTAAACLFKTTGDPLTKDDHISFNDVVLPLTDANYKQSVYKGKTIRSWGVPDGKGQWFALAEVLEMQ
jgi:hypothetical protein